MGTVSEHELRFGQNVQRVRAARGMSQQDLADQVGLGRTTVVRLERGDMRVRLGEACRIADVLNVPLGDLVADHPLTIQITLGASRSTEEAEPA